MSTTLTPARVEQFKRQAKTLARTGSLTHAEALDRLAADNGFRNWSLLAKHVARAAPPTSAAAPSPVVPSPVPKPAAPTRYYLHGDAEEGHLGRFYCARCDLFVEGSHFFSQHSRDETLERCLSAIERWAKRPASETTHRRPPGAANMLEQDARAAAATREAARGPFHRWLEKRKGRDSVVGDLAGDVLSDKDFPAEATTLDEIKGYMQRHAASGGALKALSEAWQQFQASARRGNKRELEATKA